MSAHLAKRVTALIGLAAVGLVALTATLATGGESPAGDGVVHVRSAHKLEETIRRLKDDIAAKGIRFFDDIDQGKLASEAGVALHPSHLLVFGNPPLGTQFLSADPDAGLDWPVRLLVYESPQGEVWAAYTDFAWIARRHGIESRVEQFAKAGEVIASITSSIAAP